MTLLRLSVTISLHKINEDYSNELDDYGVPFSEQQYTHGSCYISLFKCKSFDWSDQPEWPRIIDIYYSFFGLAMFLKDFLACHGIPKIKS